MGVTDQIDIKGNIETVWKAITGIENSERMISSILKINIVNNPQDTLVGLKWKETREMFGNEATETMWVTEAVTNEYYCTRAESHGSVYITRLSVAQCASGTVLTMSFSGKPQTITAKMPLFIMKPLIKRSIKKALVKDLEDVKNFVEKS